MEDECENYFEIIQTRMEIFQSYFRNYNKVNLNNLQHNLENSQSQNMKNEISSISKLENQIDYLVIDLENKFNFILKIMNSLNCETHKKILHDIEILKNTSKRLIKTYETKKRENGDQIKKLYNSNSYSEKNELISVKGECKEYNETNFKYIENYYDNIQIDDERHKIESYEKLELQEQENYDLQNALEYEQKEFQIDKENLRKINDVKNKIKDLTISINNEILKGKESLLEIEKNVSEYSENIDKTNEELRQAAILKNKTNTIKYPLIMGSIFGAAGTIVPGLGNAIGATIGTGLGMALSSLEKKAIMKVEPEKYKD